MARKFVIKQWLLVLSKLNYWYAQYTDEIIERLVDISDLAIQNVQNEFEVISDKTTLDKEKTRGSDVAAVQQIDSSVDVNNDSNDLECSELPMRYSFVLPSGNAVLGNDHLRSTLLFQNIMKMFNRNDTTDTPGNIQCELNNDENSVDDESMINEENMDEIQQPWDDPISSNNDESSESSLVSERSSSKPTFSSSEQSRHQNLYDVKSYRLDEPVNEFNTSDFILGAAFPHVFILGYAYAKKAGNLLTNERNHLLKQFTNIPSTNRRLLGYLHDVKKRFSVINGVNAHVQGNEKTVRLVKQLLEDANNQKMFQEAMKDPQGPVATEVMKKVLPILNISGGSVPYGSVETNVALTKIFEMTRRYGPAFGFLTFSFDDIHNPRAIRAAYNTVNNNCFPAIFEEDCVHGSSGIEFIQKLRKASQVQSIGHIEMLETHINNLHLQHNLAKLAIENPVAYVQESKSMIQHVLAILLGFHLNIFLHYRKANQLARPDISKLEEKAFLVIHWPILV